MWETVVKKKPYLELSDHFLNNRHSNTYHADRQTTTCAIIAHVEVEHLSRKPRRNVISRTYRGSLQETPETSKTSPQISSSSVNGTHWFATEIPRTICNKLENQHTVALADLPCIHLTRQYELLTSEMLKESQTARASRDWHSTNIRPADYYSVPTHDH